MKDVLSTLIALCGPVLLLCGWQWVRKPKQVTIEVTYEAAVEGAKLLREWCSWLATISSAALGVAAFAEKGLVAGTKSPQFATAAVFAFSLAVLCTATLLLALPSLVARLGKEPSTTNDLYEMPAFLWVPKAFKRAFRIGFLAAAQWYFFVVGIGIVAVMFASK